MYKQLNPQELKELLNERDLIIADVRDEDSYNEEHIDKAIHLSMTTLQEYCDSADKNQPILVYCYHGISSQSVAQFLVDQGFSEVYSLIGGYETWKSHQPASDAE